MIGLSPFWYRIKLVFCEHLQKNVLNLMNGSVSLYKTRNGSHIAICVNSKAVSIMQHYKKRKEKPPKRLSICGDGWDLVGVRRWMVGLVVFWGSMVVVWGWGMGEWRFSGVCFVSSYVNKYRCGISIFILVFAV